ncbi:MAG: HAD hydrolase-like protein [Oscillospiraceae bacterium]|nr:HAD hydrolase-like protein [Oscillospiraceae bacterium]
MNNYKLAVFDVDGTLLDTTEGVLSSVRHTIEHFGFEMLPEERLKGFIGPPIQDSFALAYGLEGDILQELATFFRNSYKDNDLLKAEPYNGIFDVMKALSERGITIAIATYKREDYAKTLLEHFGFDSYSDIIYGGDHFNRLKKRDIIMKCISDSGIQKLSDAVMIGDTENDAVGAMQLGIDFIGVTYGFGFKPDSLSDIAGCVGYAAEPSDLLKFF